MEDKVQQTVDNFEAVVAAGNVKLIDQNDDIKLYVDDEGNQFIYDGSTAYSQHSEEFAEMKAENFGQPNAA